MATMPEMWVEPRIHPTAIIDPSAVIESGVEIGPYSVIGKNVHIGAGTLLFAHVQIVGNTRIGRNCQIYGGAILGGLPQDTKFRNEETYVEIGDDNILREYVTIHRATGEGNVTRLGNNNMLMAYAHIAHDCEIGSHVTIASYVGISGHVTIEDYATLGGMVGIHQNCRIGMLTMVGGISGVVQDIPPYMLANGRPARVYDINKIGLRRAGITAKVRTELREAYKLLYRSNLNMAQALETIREEIETSPQLEHLIEFIHAARSGKNLRGNDVDAS